MFSFVLAAIILQVFFWMFWGIVLIVLKNSLGEGAIRERRIEES